MRRRALAAVFALVACAACAPAPEAGTGAGGTAAAPGAGRGSAALQSSTLLPSMPPAAAVRAPVPAAPPLAVTEQGADLLVGAIRFTPCTIGAQRAQGAASLAAHCARFEVPENWGDASGRHIALRLAWVRSQAAEARPDVVVFLDGGPGGAATEDYPAVAAALAPVRRHHHILLMDQRGTGGSNALDCGAQFALEGDAQGEAGDAGKGGEAGEGGDVGGAARRAAAARAARAQAHVGRCLEELRAHAAPQFYTTTATVSDLEAVRLALGGVSFDLLGVSYGTRVAQQYAARYGPDAVRSIVLDSAVPNRLALLSEHARNLEDALRGRMALCRDDAACSARFGDPYANVRSVHARLRSAPQSVEVRDAQTFALQRHVLGADEFAALVRFYLYSASTSALLPYLTHEAQQGRYAPLLAQARFVSEAVAQRLSGALAASVLCAEDADLLPDPAGDLDTLLGAGALRSAARVCAQWPHGARPADFHAPFKTALPVLLLAGQWDPVTPPRYANEIAAELPDARVLLAAGQGHAVLGAGCMPLLVGNFIDSADARGLDAHCLDRLGAQPAFLDANGGAP